MKEYVSELRKQYAEVEAMTEAEVFAEYDECKAVVLDEIGSDIDYYEDRIYGTEIPTMCYDVDPAFGSWEEVNRMFV